MDKQTIRIFFTKSHYQLANRPYQFPDPQYWGKSIKFYIIENKGKYTKTLYF